LVKQIGTIGNQTTLGNEDPLEINCRELMPGSKRDDQFTIANVRRARCHD
jgi:hypothetical protein